MKTREKLAIAINSLRLIAGSPELDDDVKRITGEDPAATPSVRLARRTLAKLGVDMTAPMRRRPDQ